MRYYLIIHDEGGKTLTPCGSDSATALAIPFIKIRSGSYKDRVPYVAYSNLKDASAALVRMSETHRKLYYIVDVTDYVQESPSIDDLDFMDDLKNGRIV
jgi:hypothetical protein